MIRCSENAPEEFFVDSSSGTKKYRIRAFMADEAPTCDCPAYMIKRNKNGGKSAGAVGDCKHLRKILAETCAWTENSPEPQTIPGICPRCASPTVDGAAEALPELPRLAADAAVERLLAMQQELTDRGVEADAEEYEAPPEPQVPTDDPAKLASDLLTHVGK